MDIECSFWFYGILRGKSLYRLHRDVLGKLRFERKFLVENMSGRDAPCRNLTDLCQRRVSRV